MSSWGTAPTDDLDGAARQGPCAGLDALVPGDAASMSSVAARLERVARGADQLTRLLRRVDAGEWTGEAGAAFRVAVAAMPGPYAQASRSFADVARVLHELSATVRRGRETARVALERWDEAQDASRRYEHEQEVWRAVRPDLVAYQAQTGSSVLQCSDPGEWGRAEARRMVAEAQREVEEADGRALRTILSATRDAPRDSGWGDVAAGARAGTLGVVTGAYGLTPFADDAGSNWAALWSQWKDPVGTLQDTGRAFADNPDTFLGALLPSLLLGGVTKGLADRTPHGPATPADPMGPGVMHDVPAMPVPQWPGLDRGPHLMRSAEWVVTQSAKIAAHSWPKHGERLKQFPWVDGEAGLADYVAGVISSPSESFTELPGRTLYWDAERKVMVIQQDGHSGTVYPARKSHYDIQVKKAQEALDALKRRGGTP